MKTSTGFKNAMLVLGWIFGVVALGIHIEGQVKAKAAATAADAAKKKAAFYEEKYDWAMDQWAANEVRYQICVSRK